MLRAVLVFGLACSGCAPGLWTRLTKCQAPTGEWRDCYEIEMERRRNVARLAEEESRRAAEEQRRAAELAAYARRARAWCAWAVTAPESTPEQKIWCHERIQADQDMYRQQEIAAQQAQAQAQIEAARAAQDAAKAARAAAISNAINAAKPAPPPPPAISPTVRTDCHRIGNNVNCTSRATPF